METARSGSQQLYFLLSLTNFPLTRVQISRIIEIEIIKVDIEWKLFDVIPFIINEEITDGVKGFCCYIHTVLSGDFLFLVPFF
jgi:hypothetical protein